MAAIPRAQCLCSTVGFEQPAWNDIYYPEECPREWRLAYFMNDFRAVYLPASQWATSRQIQLISEELDDDFELILEWPTENHADPHKLLLQLEGLRENVSCIVVDIDLLDASRQDAICRAISAHFTLNLDSKTLSDEQRATLSRRYGSRFVWRPDSWPLDMGGKGYQVARVPCLALRTFKNVLDTLRPLLEQDARVGMFLEPEAQSAGRALEVRTVIELMGLA